MRILWCINWPFPDVSEQLGLKMFVSQGWLISLAEHISSKTDIQLSVLCQYTGGHDMKSVRIGAIQPLCNTTQEALSGCGCV